MPYDFKSEDRTIEKTVARIAGAVYDELSWLEAEYWLTPEPVPYGERMTGSRHTAVVGQIWGNLWDCAWFHFTGRIPVSAAGRAVVALIDLSGEGCVFDGTGCPVQGLTSGTPNFDPIYGNPGKRVVRLCDSARGGEAVDLWVDAGCNDLFGNNHGGGTLREARIVACNTETNQLYYDFQVLYELMKQLPEDSARMRRIRESLFDACAKLGDVTPQAAAQAKGLLKTELGRKGGDAPLTVSAVGHSHIDLAWLWPVRETIRKGARTFSTVLRNMERYPDYVFGASQAQLYVWMKEYYPALYDQVKERIAQGRWEVQGGMWVEPDTNITGGESLVRQFLYGKRFFMDEFGKDMEILWLPDVFGYSGALPQIMEKSGVHYFMTQKLSWNDTDKMPHQTFIWRGIDGTGVLTHMPPECTYNSSATPQAVKKAETQYDDSGVCDRSLLLFGIGDGGGGPGEEHLEALRREKNLEGLAPVVQEPAIDFFRHIGKDCEKYHSWSGELYFEFHRGTYTTQARNKRFNRKLEFALRELEFVSAVAMLGGRPYPEQELGAIWKETLLYQFHDILPGSSITRVYEESLKRYDEMLFRAEQLRDTAVDSLLEAAAGPKPGVFVMNSLSWDRREWVHPAGKWLHVTAPACGAAVFADGEGDEVPDVCHVSVDRLENDLLSVIFNPDGSIASVFDKEQDREVLMKGEAANVLAVYRDDGDAWDFDKMYKIYGYNAFSLTGVSNKSEGPRVVRSSEYRYGNSTLRQDVILTSGSTRIDFITIVDWREKGRMLRTSFPLDILTMNARCEIQFGNIERPTHRNTGWDSAKIEFPAQKWVDLSQGDYGAALLNDCKYGYSAEGHTLELNLLRSPSYPDPAADIAEHRFSYALLPHTGDYRAGNVVREAYEFNAPLYIRHVDGILPGRVLEPLIKPDVRNVVVETVKKSEDGGDMIIRLYECEGKSVRAKLMTGFRHRGAAVADLMENKVESEAFNADAMTLEFHPFEIHTLRFTL